MKCVASLVYPLQLLVAAGSVALVSAPVPGHAAEKSRVWFEQGVATITTGYDAAARRFTHRKFYALALGPNGFSGSAHDVARQCSARVTGEVGERLRLALWDVATNQGVELVNGDDGARSAGYTRQNTQIDAAVNDATARFRTQLTACAKGRFDATTFELGLVQRVCDTRTNSCSNTTQAWADHPAARAFSALSSWVDARDGKHPTLPANAMVVLPDSIDAGITLKRLQVSEANEALAKCRAEVEKTTPGPKTRPLTCLALEMASRTFSESNVWPDAPPASVSQAQFELLVQRARVLNKRLDSSVPRIADVPREVAVRVVDVLNDPQQAILDLRTDPRANLQSIQDELARSRIVECAKFRNLTNPADIEKCSGYRVDLSRIQQCLTGGACVPEFGPSGYASVIAQLHTGGVRSLAVGSLSPRTSAQLNQLESLARECAKAGSHSAAATCVLERQLGAAERRAWQCVNGKAPGQLDTKAVECATGGVLPPEAARAVECARRFNTAADQARCALEGNLPPAAVALFECQRRNSSQNAKAVCMASAAGGDVGKAAACLQSSDGDWAAGATCFAKDKVPGPVADALECSQRSSDAAGLGTCLATKNLPPNIRKPAQCVAENGGNPLGAGVCMTSDNLGLNPDQRIALECLASTGGEPVSFATCTGGRLFVKEMFNCVDKKLFEGNCMGENNEIRKFLKAVGINLSPNTVVGQALNTPLDVVKFQVAVAQSVLQGAEQLTNNIGREMDRAKKNIDREVSKGIQNVGREGARIVDQGKTDVNNGIGWVSDRIGIRLPRF